MKIGKKRPGLRSIHDIKNFMLESIELAARGLITSADLRARTAAAKDTAEVHAAVKLMELQGISFDLEAEATGLDYAPAVKRVRTVRSGMTAKGPIEEEIMQETQEAGAGSTEADLGKPATLADRLARIPAALEDQSDPEDEDIIPF